MDQRLSVRLQIPAATEQTCYFATGALAGACTQPIDYAWQSLVARKPPALSTFLRNASTPAVYRAGVRFWMFDHARTNLKNTSIPYSAAAGLAGAWGGFSEVVVQSALQRQLPSLVGLVAQSSRLFFCFGTYTWISSTFSETVVPKPFWKCWLMGATAGAVGSAIVGAAEGARGKMLFGTVVPKGALTIGTVIAVQVTSCAAILEKVQA